MFGNRRFLETHSWLKKISGMKAVGMRVIAVNVLERQNIIRGVQGLKAV
jgi:hypothetical protein